MIQGGELILYWSYSGHHFEKETIWIITENLNQHLEALISIA
jgi:hypothetical protein